MATAADIMDNMASRFNSEKAGDTNLSIVFDLSGDDGGQWTASISGGSVNVAKEVGDSPSATVKMDAGDFVDMSTGKLNPMMAFMSGKIKVEGDLNSVMKFQSLLGM